MGFSTLKVSYINDEPGYEHQVEVTTYEIILRIHKIQEPVAISKEY